MGIRNGGFKSPDDRRRFLASYHQMRKLGAFPDAIRDIPTDVGAIRVYQHGSGARPPLVLIHGFFLTSAMWWKQVDSLMADFTVYTVDMPGQPGASNQTASMPTPHDCAHVLDQVFDGLGLQDIHLVAHSYGGWLATHTAAATPWRFTTLTLIDPAHTVTRLSGRFWRSLATLLVRPRSAKAEQAAAWLTGNPAHQNEAGMLCRLFLTGFGTFGAPRRTPPLRYAPDHLLQSVPVPVQVLLAGNSIHNCTAAIERMRAVVPAWTHRLWPQASHLLPVEHADEVNACIREFALSRQK